MSGNTARTELNDNQIRIRGSDVAFNPRRSDLYKLSIIGYKDSLGCYSIPSLSFSIPFLGRISHIIQLPLDHFHPTLVDHLSPHLSTHPIKHLLWLSVSRGGQGSTIQRSSPHKCDQKSNCNAFNAVVVAFPQIFLGFLPSRTFMRRVPIIGASWRVTLIVGVHT